MDLPSAFVLPSQITVPLQERNEEENTDSSDCSETSDDSSTCGSDSESRVPICELSVILEEPEDDVNDVTSYSNPAFESDGEIFPTDCSNSIGSDPDSGTNFAFEGDKLSQSNAFGLSDSFDGFSLLDTQLSNVSQDFCEPEENKLDISFCECTSIENLSHLATSLEPTIIDGISDKPNIIPYLDFCQEIFINSSGLSDDPSGKLEPSSSQQSNQNACTDDLITEHVFPEVCILNISTDSGNRSQSWASGSSESNTLPFTNRKDSGIDNNFEQKPIYNIEDAFRVLTAEITEIISPDILQISFNDSFAFSNPTDISCLSGDITDSENSEYLSLSRMETKTPPSGDSDVPSPKLPNPYADAVKKKKPHGYYNETGFPFDSTQKMPDKSIEDDNSSDASVDIEVGEMEMEEETQPKSCKTKALSIASIVCRILSLFVILYFFICSLDLLSSAFTLLGGRVAGEAFQSPLLQNPICGLMIGVVSTAFLQSSSTSTSIVVTLVASNLLTVEQAIPIIMGANIGTSVTGVIVAVTQASDKETFERAFSAATVHDMFNWLTVMILLPLELITGYLYHVSEAIVNSTKLAGGQSEKQFLSIITDPFTDLIVQIDKSVLDDIATGDPSADNKSLLKYWCEYDSVLVEGATTAQDGNTGMPLTTMVGVTECRYLFHGTSLSEQAVGAILLLMSLTMLIGCLILMVKILKSLLQGHMAGVIKKTVNADFPGKLAFLTGYVAILVGAVVTVLVQSSSVVSSVLTPLAGVGAVTLERVFPMMLGANIGTTSTAILAAFSATGDRIVPSFQIAMCHLFFNLTGILIWYPIPHMRRVPLKLARFLGKTTAKYRWFAFAYLVSMFFLLPFCVFLLSIPGWWLLTSVLVPVILIFIIIGAINAIQKRRPQWLPNELQDWEFLPLCCRSLEPMDRTMTSLITKCNCCGCCDTILNADTEDEKTDELRDIDNNVTSTRNHENDESGHDINSESKQNRGACVIEINNPKTRANNGNRSRNYSTGILDESSERINSPVNPRMRTGSTGSGQNGSSRVRDVLYHPVPTALDQSNVTDSATVHSGNIRLQKNGFGSKSSLGSMKFESAV